MPGKNHSVLLPIAVVVASVTLLVGCAGSSPSIDTSAEAELSFDGLYPIKGGAADAAWARPDADISNYSKIMLQGVGIEYRPGGESGRLYHSRSSNDHFEITEKQKANFERIVHDAFLKELGESERFSIVDQPGPDVLLIRGGLLDVVSYAPPEPISRGEVFLRSVGEATLVLEIRDSVSEAILARAVDRRAAEKSGGDLGRSNPVMNRADVRRMAGTWARLLRERLDSYGAPK